MFRVTMDNISKIFPNMAADLDEDLGNVRIQLDSQQKSQEDELLEYFGRFNLEGSESTTPISGPEKEPPKLEFLEKKVLDLKQIFRNPLPEYSDNSNSTDLNNAKTQDMVVSPVGLYNPNPTDWSSKAKISSNHNMGRAEKIKHFGYKSNLGEMNYTVSSVRNVAPSIGSDKWVNEKEKFLDSTPLKCYVDSTNKRENQILGTVKVKESFIELPRIGRISKSFHGKSASKDSYLDIEPTPRRASDNMVNLSSTFLNTKPVGADSSHEEKPTVRPKFCTQKSQPCPVSLKEEFRKTSLSEPQNFKGARFTTTLVDENLFLEGLKSSSTPK